MNTTTNTVREIPEKFSLKGDEFTRVFENENFYIYMRTHCEKNYYEVFRKKVVDCIDYETKQPTGEQKYSYPKDESFGVWAWCCGSLPDAMKYLRPINLTKPG